jgi:protein-S-isoprenylcysteine O-methyltransferase Ste14
MYRARTTILPHRRSDALVTSGPFRRFRNPIYLGDVMVLLGLAELTKNIWFVAVAIAFAGLVTWLAILPEERHLEARFGEAWRHYKARSRRWL